MNVLYIGPNDSEWAQMHRPVSLAAAKWARGFLAALSKFVEVTALCHTYEIAWPKGRVFWRRWDTRLCPVDWPCEYVSYPVLRYVRDLWWSCIYPLKANRIIGRKHIDVVLIYNCNIYWEVKTLARIRRKNPQVKIFPIILDGDDPRKDDWGWIKRAAAFADGFICLSWWVHQNITAHTGKPSYHFDGGADKWCGTEAKLGARQIKTLVHTGALDQWRGLEFMIEVVKRLTEKRKDVKFVFCGKSGADRLKKVFGNNPQVELPGFVTESKMEDICNSADVLLNVRDPSHPDNILNYPSKLPHYLSFGRPIVSTPLQSLSPDYADVVEFPEDDTVEVYLDKIEEVLAWDDERKMMKYQKIKNWFASRKRWDVMVQGLLEKLMA